METIGLSSSLPSAFSVGWTGQEAGIALGQDTNLAGSNFLATLLAMAGHDLRQPLQVITSAQNVLARMLHSDQQREELSRAEHATKRLASMLGQLVEALELHERSGDHLYQPVRLGPILDDLAVEFARSARLKGITLRLGLTVGVARSHPVLLTGMLRNLIRNAIDYTPPGGSVSVASRRFGSQLRIEVCDTGVGIPAKALSTIFGAFQRADQSRTDGLGLGLFIVKHAADLLGHRIEVRSDEGCGSCFTIIADINGQQRQRTGFADRTYPKAVSPDGLPDRHRRKAPQWRRVSNLGHCNKVRPESNI